MSRRRGNYTFSAQLAKARRKTRSVRPRGAPNKKANFKPQIEQDIPELPVASAESKIPDKFLNTPYYTKKKRVLQYNRARWRNFPVIAAPKIKYLYPEEYNEWLVEEINVTNERRTEKKPDYHDGWQHPQKVDRELRELKRAVDKHYSKRDKKIRLGGLGSKQKYVIDSRKRGEPIRVETRKIPAFAENVRFQLDANGYTNKKIPPYIEFTEEEITSIIAFDKEVKENERKLLQTKRFKDLQTATIKEKDGVITKATPQKAYERKMQDEEAKTIQWQKDVITIEKQMSDYQKSVSEPVQAVGKIVGDVARNVAEGVIAAGVVATGGGMALAGKVAMGEVRPKTGTMGGIGGVLGTAKQAYQEEREIKVDKEIEKLNKDVVEGNITEADAISRLERIRYQTGGIEVTAKTRKGTPIKTMNLTPKSTLNPKTKEKIDAAISGLGGGIVDKQVDEINKKVEEQTTSPVGAEKQLTALLKQQQVKKVKNPATITKINEAIESLETTQKEERKEKITEEINSEIEEIKEQVDNNTLTPDKAKEKLEEIQVKLKTEKLDRTLAKTVNKTIDEAVKANEITTKKQEKEKLKQEYIDKNIVLKGMERERQKEAIDGLVASGVTVEDYQKAEKEIPGELENRFKKVKELAITYVKAREQPDKADNSINKREHILDQVKGKIIATRNKKEKEEKSKKREEEKKAKQLKEEENAKKLKEIQRKGDEEAELEKVKREQLEIAKGVGAEVEAKKGEKLRKEFEEFKRQNQLKEEREKAKKEALGAE